MRILLATLALLPLTACIGALGYSSLDQVATAAREYNEDVRWGRDDKAAKHVPTDIRQRFIDKHANLEEDLEIADFEMSGLELDKKKQTATTRVDYTRTPK